MHRRLSRVLVVEDDADLRHAISRLVKGWGAEALEAATVREAIALLHPAPDAILLDLNLGDGSGFEVLEEARSVWPAPVKVALSGVASPTDAFRLAGFGVRAYLQKPVSLEELEKAVSSACAHEPEITPLIQDSVGHVSVRQLQSEVRDVMLRQSLALSRGSRSGAARLLHVTRQAVQQMIRKPGARPPQDTGKGDAGTSKDACGPEASGSV
jgi:DNA-binding response OmpR family regulator